MLVLSRKIGERIHIGDEVFIEIRRVAGNRVTIAVNAPREVRILRGELLEDADAFEVLHEPAVDESAKDTVIMKAKCEVPNAEAKTESQKLTVKS